MCRRISLLTLFCLVDFGIMCPESAAEINFDPVELLQIHLRQLEQEIEDDEKALGRLLRKPALVGLEGDEFYLKADTPRFRDAGLRLASQIPAMRIIRASGSSISNDGLSGLGRLEKLERLDLSRTSITDASLAHLAGLKNLRRLYLRDTAVTDEGLEKLYGLKSLEYLDVVGTEITGNGVMGVQSALRDCRLLHRPIDAELLETMYAGSDLRLIKGILDRGADVNVRNGDGRTLLVELAVYATPENIHRFQPAIELLLSRGAKVDVGSTSFVRHMDMRVFDLVKLLVRHGATLDKAAMIHAAQWISPEQLRVFAEHFRDREDKAEMLGYALVAVAGKRDDVESVDMLLDHGADSDTVIDDNNTTALHLAVVKRHLRVTRRLIDHGANVQAKMTTGRSALHYWAMSRSYTAPEETTDLEIGELLLKHGLDVNLRDGCNMTPLHIAINGKHSDKVRWLVERGADVNIPYQYESKTPLVMVIRQHPELASLLVKHGARVNAAPEAIHVPLHWAVASGNFELTRLLLEHGANPNAKARSKFTALAIARELENNDITQLLKQHGAKDEDVP